MDVVPARICKGRSSMGWTPYWIADLDGNLLHIEPVCTVPDKCHEWFKQYIEAMEFEYWGVRESPREDLSEASKQEEEEG